MMKKNMRLNVVTFVLFTARAVSAQEAVQIPSTVKAEVLAIQDRFTSALEEECPSTQCFAVGCQVSRFLTLDEQQSASLPGLESTAGKPSDQVQYKLASVRCEFTYEPSITDDALVSIRQRLAQKVKPVGVSVALVSRKLNPKSSEEEQSSELLTKSEYLPTTWYGALFASLLPVAPWVLLIVALVAGVLALLWGYRSLGKPKAKKATKTSLLGAPTADVHGPLARVEPSHLQMLHRIQHLREMIEENPRIAEVSLRADLEAENYAFLSLFIKHFGPQYLNSFKEQPEFRENLSALAKFYKEDQKQENSLELWDYLDKLERSLVAAKVQVDQEPLESEFSFLAALAVEELVGILKEVSEQEAVAAIAYAPRGLRERFFASTSPSFTVNFIEQLTQVDKLPDSFVREAARKMRQIYYTKGETLRTINVDKYPLLEQALNALEPGKRRQLMLDMSKDNPGLMKSLAPTVFLDDALNHLGDKHLTEAFLSAEPQDLAEYIRTLSDGEAILERLNPRLRTSVRSLVRPGKAIDLKRAGLARQAIANFVKKLSQDGEIDLRSINEQILS